MISYFIIANYINQKFYQKQFSSEHRTKRDKKKVGFEQKPDIKSITSDYIGPPDKLSNLRPVLRHIPKDETPIERELRLKKIEIEEWNQKFWTIHNKKFITVSYFHRSSLNH